MLRASLLPYRLPLEGGVIGVGLLWVQLRALLLPDDLLLHLRTKMTERASHLLMVRVRQRSGCEVAVAFEEWSGFQKAVFSRSIVGAHVVKRVVAGVALKGEGAISQGGLGHRVAYFQGHVCDTSEFFG